jgi:DNA-binding XRE family transcriptional regulator
MIAPVQLRAARAFLDWTRADCGSAAGVSPETIKNIETGRFQPEAETVRKIGLTFAARGVGFFDAIASRKAWGVFLRRPENDNDPAVADKQTKDALALAGRMADAIVATIKKRGQCRPRDLEA